MAFWGTRKSGVVLALTAALLTCAPTARADDCQLKLAASLNLGHTEEGLPTANVIIGGNDYSFLLATASIISIMNFTTYTTLKVNHMHASGVFEGPDELTNVAIVPELTLGGLKGVMQQFYVTEDTLLPPGVVGKIGLDKLERYDVELDLAHDKFNMFSPDHCRGRLVYWTDTAVSVPFVVQDRDRQFMVPMKLDDAAINVLIDTGASVSAMTYAAAHRLLGIERKNLQPYDPKASTHSHVYRYPFKTLQVGGLAITNPNIAIVDKGDEERVCNGESHDTSTGRSYRCYGGGDLHLGLKQLRQLRVIVAFSEKMLYVTPADAH